MSPDSMSVQRRPMDVEDYIDVFRRHKAWILGPTFAGLVIAVVVAFLWPDTYVSTAVIRVVPPQVPESYVPSNVNMEMSSRINSMAQTILSRGNLTNIITTFNLYPRERQRQTMEDVVEEMRKNIRIGNVTSLTNQERKGISAFTVTFYYQNRIMAQKVASDVVSRFMSENTRARTTESVLTTQFLTDQVQNAKKELDAIEERLKNFRMTYQGRLPGETQVNQNHLNALEQRIANVNGAISRVQQEKLVYESEMRTLKNQLASLQLPPEAVAQQVKNEALVAKDREIAQMEQQLATLREHYKDNYPDVRRLVSQINVAKRSRDNLLKEEEARKAEAPASTAPSKRYDPNYERESRALVAAIERVQSQIKARELQAEDYAKEIAATEKQIKLIQARIEATPVSEAQYSEVIRDREAAKLRYDDLSRKQAQSKISEELEKRQQGETLEVLDPATLPQSPVEPKRPILIAVGTMMGLFLGVFLAGAREAKDASLKNLKDVRAYTQLTVLGSVPLLENDLVVRRRRRLAWLAWSTACLLGIVIMTGSVLFYYTTKA